MPLLASFPAEQKAVKKKMSHLNSLHLVLEALIVTETSPTWRTSHRDWSGSSPHIGFLTLNWKILPIKEPSIIMVHMALYIKL
jgi:hypothetical protein